MMFSPMQLVEKRLERQGHMALWIYKKSVDTVPRKMVMTTAKWIRAPESEVKIVEAM